MASSSRRHSCSYRPRQKYSFSENGLTDEKLNVNISQKTVVASYPSGIFGSINMSVSNNLQNKLVFIPTR